MCGMKRFFFFRIFRIYFKLVRNLEWFAHRNFRSRKNTRTTAFMLKYESVYEIKICRCSSIARECLFSYRLRTPLLPQHAIIFPVLLQIFPFQDFLGNPSSLSLTQILSRYTQIRTQKTLKLTAKLKNYFWRLKSKKCQIIQQKNFSQVHHSKEYVFN